MIEELLRGQIKGTVTVSLLDHAGKVCEEFFTQNLIVNQAADILGRLISGGSPLINVMYIEYTANATSITSVAPAVTDVCEYFRSGPNTADKDYLRIPISGTPIIGASSASYVSNKLTFTTFTTTSQGGNGNIDFTPGAVKVLGAGLAAAPSITTESSDLLFSRVAFDPVIAVTASRQLAIQWVITLT